MIPNSLHSVKEGRGTDKIKKFKCDHMWSRLDVTVTVAFILGYQDFSSAFNTIQPNHS